MRSNWLVALAIFGALGGLSSEASAMRLSKDPKGAPEQKFRALSFGDSATFTIMGGAYANGFVERGDFDKTEGLFSLDRTIDLGGDQRYTALLVDGRYNFVYDVEDKVSWKPYVGGGIGIATRAGQPLLPFSGGGAFPLLRMGGGVAYRLGKQWNLSLDYSKSVFGQPLSGDQIFTGRGQQPVDLQSLNMELKLQF